MDRVTRADLEDLVREDGTGPHVSLFTPTDRSGTSVQADRIAWKNLLTGTESVLGERGMRPPDVAELLAPAWELHDDELAWQYMGDGLAFYLRPGAHRSFRGPPPAAEGRDRRRPLRHRPAAQARRLRPALPGAGAEPAADPRAGGKHAARRGDESCATSPRACGTSSRRRSRARTPWRGRWGAVAERAAPCSTATAPPRGAQEGRGQAVPASRRERAPRAPRRPGPAHGPGGPGRPGGDVPGGQLLPAPDGRGGPAQPGRPLRRGAARRGMGRHRANHRRARRWTRTRRAVPGDLHGTGLASADPDGDRTGRGPKGGWTRSSSASRSGAGKSCRAPPRWSGSASPAGRSRAAEDRPCGRGDPLSPEAGSTWPRSRRRSTAPR